MVTYYKMVRQPVSWHVLVRINAFSISAVHGGNPANHMLVVSPCLPCFNFHSVSLLSSAWFFLKQSEISKRKAWLVTIREQAIIKQKMIHSTEKRWQSEAILTWCRNEDIFRSVPNPNLLHHIHWNDASRFKATVTSNFQIVSFKLILGTWETVFRSTLLWPREGIPSCHWNPTILHTSLDNKLSNKTN